MNIENNNNNEKGMRLILIFFMGMVFLKVIGVTLGGIVHQSVFLGMILNPPLSIIGNILSLAIPIIIYLLLWYKKGYKIVMSLGYFMILNTLLGAIWIFLVPTEQLNLDKPESLVNTAKSIMIIFPLLWAIILFLIFRYVRKHKYYFIG